MRTDGRMAELVPFTVPLESDKTLLVWELSSGPTAEALHVSWVRVEGGMQEAASRCLGIPESLSLSTSPVLSPLRGILALEGTSAVS